MATKFMTLDGKEKKKETVFTHYIDSCKELSECYSSPKDWANVLHIGYDVDYGDVFKCWDYADTNHFGIYFGVKGDEFDG